MTLNIVETQDFASLQKYRIMNHKRKFFDCHAKGWDQQHSPENEREIQKLVSKLNIEKGSRILDIGCGTGALLPHLAKNMGKNGKLFALDFSLEMLTKAKQKKIAKNIAYINADAQYLPFKENCFDYVTCFATFPHIDDQQKSLLEMARTLKSKGKVFVLHLSSREKINAFHSKLDKSVARDFLPNKRNMRQMMLKADFKDINITNKPNLYLASGVKL